MPLCASRFGRLPIACVVVVGLLLVPSGASAQYLGHDIRGDNGLSAGSQPFPGVYFAIPYYRYDVHSLHDRDGHENSALPFPTMEGFGGSVMVVTNAKILGAHYGFAAGPVFWMQDLIDVPRQDIHTATGFAFFDTYYQPLSLGWTTKHADFIAGYGFFAPTGDFEAHEGLGMWSHELSGGSTVYFGKTRRVSAATAADLELHTKKQDEDIHVGNILTLEGGVAARFEHGINQFGLAYYAQWKVSDDTGADLPVDALARFNLVGRQRVYGFGPEATFKLFARGTTIAMATVRYFWESGAKSAFEGQALFVALTVGRLWPRKGP